MESLDARLPVPTGTAWETVGRLSRWVCQQRQEVSVDGAVLAVKAAAMSVLAGAGASSLGVPFRAFLPGVILGGFTVYAIEAFQSHWDAKHRIAAAIALPAAIAAVPSAIGPIGVAAATVAAGSYGPELCASLVQNRLS